MPSASTTSVLGAVAFILCEAVDAHPIRTYVNRQQYTANNKEKLLLIIKLLQIEAPRAKNLHHSSAFDPHPPSANPSADGVAAYGESANYGELA